MRHRMTVAEVAHQEAVFASRLREMGFEDDADFLAADASERQRLSEIIKEEEERDWVEFKAWQKTNAPQKERA